MRTRAIGQSVADHLELARNDRGPENSEDPRRRLCIRLRTTVPEWLKDSNAPSEYLKDIRNDKAVICSPWEDVGSEET